MKTISMDYKEYKDVLRKTRDDGVDIGFYQVVQAFKNGFTLEQALKDNICFGESVARRLTEIYELRGNI